MAEFHIDACRETIPSPKQRAARPDDPSIQRFSLAEKLAVTLARSLSLNDLAAVAKGRAFDSPEADKTYRDIVEDAARTGIDIDMCFPSLVGALAAHLFRDSARNSTSLQEQAQESSKAFDAVRGEIDGTANGLARAFVRDVHQARRRY